VFAREEENHAAESCGANSEEEFDPALADLFVLEYCITKVCVFGKQEFLVVDVHAWAHPFHQALRFPFGLDQRRRTFQLDLLKLTLRRTAVRTFTGIYVTGATLDSRDTSNASTRLACPLISQFGSAKLTQASYS